MKQTFPKISEDFPKLFRRPYERSRTFSENFRKFTKMSEDVRICPKIFEEDPKMFRWYTNELKYTWIFENRVSEDKGSFYYLAIKSNKIRPKADKKAYIWRRTVS